MALYTLSGLGTHALTAGTTGLQVTITTPSAIGGLGRSNPVARYDQGLIRFSDGTAYWPPVAILGGPQFIPVPANATSIGYALLGGAVVSVVEVIGGVLFFSVGTQSVETLSDVLITSIADGQVLAWNAGAAKWENATPAASSGLYTAYLCYQDQKAQSTAGGTFTSGAWRTRDLTTEVADAGNHGALAANQITLDAGTYRCFASCPTWRTDVHQARLQDVTNAVTLALGTVEVNAPAESNGNRSIVVGRLTLAATAHLELQHRCAVSQPTNGFGLPGNFTTEVYSVLELWKEA